MPCPLCQQENPTGQKFCGECGTSLASPNQGGPPATSYADLQREVEHLARALSESLEQQTATSEILQVISASPTQLQPVLDAISERAARLCDAWNGTIVLGDGQGLRMEAHYGPLTEQLGMRLPIDQGSVSGRAFLERHPVHVDDLSEAADFPLGRQIAIRFGVRTILAVPLLREAVPIGVILIRRTEIRPFSNKQIALLQTFADQAVIAIENVRLFSELEEKNRALTQAHGQVTEALEQQTATAEVLQVISRSPTDVRPVFDTIVQNARRLCGADSAGVLTYDGEQIQIESLDNANLDRADALRRAYPMPANRGHATGRAILTGRPVQIPDVREDPEYALDALRDTVGLRSVLSVPMIRDRIPIPIGAITVQRWATPRPFSEKQIALLKTFSDQAVIAVANVRLFTELQEKNQALTEAHAQVTEALEQQTATSEILKAISRSTFDLQPVFDTMAENAVRLCEAERAFIFQFDGELLRAAASYNVGTEIREFVYRNPIAPGRQSISARAALERRTVHIPDVRADPDYAYAARDVDLIRTMLAVPIVKSQELLGTITIYRLQVKPFTDKQVSLVETFADQAVIAIENVRLFKELEARNRDLTEALEQQTATSEILRVISRSPTDLQPMFDAVAENAARLCDSFDANIFRRDGDFMRLVGHYGSIPIQLTIPLVRGTVNGRAVLEGRAVHVADVQTQVGEFPEGSENARKMGHRTILSVPLMREGVAIGTIGVRRTEVRLFAERQVALLQTFADQAVIAIENVRLFTELQEKNRALTAAHAQVTEALEQQTATAEILRVISSSQTDVQPVFDTIVRSAVRLCGGLFSALFQFDGELIHHVANHNHTAEAIDEVHRIYPARPTRDLFTGRAILERAVVHIPNVELDPEFQHRAISRAIGFRSGLWVPMLREGNPIGVIVVNRAEAGPFSDSEIELLKTFADQAVIAVENARLFKELQARTGELTQSVEKLTALGEVSRAVTSTLDVETVLDTIVSRASQLAGADGCSIFEYDEAAEQFELRAIHNDDPAFVEALRAVPVRKGEGLMGRAAEIREPIQVPDITQPGAYQSSARDTLIRFGYRAVLSVPLLREDQIIGSLSFNRKAPGEFSPEVVEVLNTFATQSVLAIQNARLFHEIADKSRQLEAASQHKSEFLANMSHELRTPLNAIIGFSEVLAQGMFGAINDKQTEYLHDILESGRHLLSLINDILDLSKIEAGRMELELIDFDLPQAIQNALTLVRERALRRGIALHHAIDDRVAAIRSDERKVKQVLLNLLSNAIKFTPEGGRIEVRAASTDGMVEVSVTDTGFGIAPEDQDAVFEEFRQVGTADKKAEGTGLGLALSRKFIELHGGRIWVTSQVGVGSTFTFTLPVRPWPAS